MKRRSCIYEGSVRHRRFHPVFHEFRYSMFMMYLDLEELPSLFSNIPLWSYRRANLASFRREDYWGDPRQDLATSIRELIQERAEVEFAGDIRLLTHLRYFGHCFNPASFYYCYEEGSGGLKHVVTEITNTPWGERHAYLNSFTGSKGTETFSLRKNFHVSPFMEMDLNYRWKFSNPGETLGIHMENHRNEAKIFDATLQMKRREIEAWRLNAMLIKYPFLCLRVLTGIYYQALRLKMKRVPFHPHP